MFTVGVWTAAMQEHRLPLQMVRPFQSCLPTGISCSTAQRVQLQQMSDAAIVVSKEGNKGAGKTTQRRLCRLEFLRGHSHLPNPVPAVSSVTPVHETRPGILASVFPTFPGVAPESRCRHSLVLMTHNSPHWAFPSLLSSKTLAIRILLWTIQLQIQTPYGSNQTQTHLPQNYALS